MRPTRKVIATGALALFLMPAVCRHANAATVSTDTAKAEKTADSSSAAAADPAASLPATPEPSASMASGMYYSGVTNMGMPRVELFLGYSYLRAVPTLSAGNRLVWLNGGSTSIAFNLNRHFGIVGDFGGFDDSQLRLAGTNPAVISNSSGKVYTYLFGPRLSFRNHDRITPFAQVLFGGIHASAVTITAGCSGVGCTPLPVENKFAATAGVGLDLRVHRHLAIRIIQAEYLMTRFTDLDTGASASQNDVRLSSGIVFRFGGAPGALSVAPAPASSPLDYSCSVNPSSVYAGEAIAGSGTALNLNSIHPAVYSWTSNGGAVSGTSSTVKIDTSNVPPGSYTLKGHVSDGPGTGENADCTASYEVKAYDPPTVSCSASPSLIGPGETSTITAVGASPQSRPLTYSYTSMPGSIGGTDSTATLSTGGTTSGVIAVNCSVADDLGHTATSATTVTVAAPVVAEKPTTVELCSIHFSRDARRPSRVDNEAKACLDEIALNLQKNSDATLAIIGNVEHGERDGQHLASQRGTNTKAYLVGDKGIDASRIVVYTGHQDGTTVTLTLIPTGATFDSAGDSPIQ